MQQQQKTINETEEVCMMGFTIEEAYLAAANYLIFLLFKHKCNPDGYKTNCEKIKKFKNDFLNIFIKLGSPYWFSKPFFPTYHEIGCFPEKFHPFLKQALMNADISPQKVLKNYKKNYGDSVEVYVSVNPSNVTVTKKKSYCQDQVLLAYGGTTEFYAHVLECVDELLRDRIFFLCCS